MDSDADKDEDQLLRASEKPSEKEDADYSSLHGHFLRNFSGVSQCYDIMIF